VPACRPARRATQASTPGFDLLNTLVAQVVPLVITSMAGKKMPNLGAILDCVSLDAPELALLGPRTALHQGGPADSLPERRDRSVPARELVRTARLMGMAAQRHTQMSLLQWLAVHRFADRAALAS
jgi:hypothetical protein